MELSTPIYIKDLQQILPHRYPSLLIDRVIQIESRNYIVAIKNVSIEAKVWAVVGARSGSVSREKIMIEANMRA